jgi:hypothetical protein
MPKVWGYTQDGIPVDRNGKVIKTTASLKASKTSLKAYKLFGMVVSTLRCGKKWRIVAGANKLCKLMKKRVSVDIKNNTTRLFNANDNFLIQHNI